MSGGGGLFSELAWPAGAATSAVSGGELVGNWSRWFWDDHVWLPPNVTWEDLRPTEEASYSNFRDLWLPLPAALIMMALRIICEKLWFRPLGIHLGLRASRRHRRAPDNPALEKVFQRRQQKGFRLTSASAAESPEVAASATSNGAAAAALASSQQQYLGEREELLQVCRTLQMTERQVDRWMRKRKLQDKPNTLDKFAETGWRWFYYTAVFGYGVLSLWDKPWLWDIRHCWYQYPKHVVEPSVWWYYMVELSFYWSLAISQFFDVRRKDFWEMFIHHMTTIALLGFSWTCHFTRVGTLVLLIHDIADVFLEAAKLCKYTNYQRMCDALFACFALTWIITRLGVYPTWILYSTTIEAPQIVEMFPAYYFFNGLLSVLLVLHVIWTYFILKIVYKAMYSGKTEKDTRSESSDVTISSSSSGDAGAIAATATSNANSKKDD